MGLKEGGLRVFGFLGFFFVSIDEFQVELGKEVKRQQIRIRGRKLNRESYREREIEVRNGDGEEMEIEKCWLEQRRDRKDVLEKEI